MAAVAISAAKVDSDFSIESSLTYAGEPDAYGAVHSVELTIIGQPRKQCIVQSDTGVFCGYAADTKQIQLSPLIITFMHYLLASRHSHDIQKGDLSDIC